MIPNNSVLKLLLDNNYPPILTPHLPQIKNPHKREKLCQIKTRKKHKGKNTLKINQLFALKYLASATGQGEIN